jgi:hypothetical protein
MLNVFCICFHSTFFCITLYVHLCSAIILQLGASTLAPGQTTDLHWTRQSDDPTGFTLVMYQGGQSASDGGISLSTSGQASGTVTFKADQGLKDGYVIIDFNTLVEPF